MQIRQYANKILGFDSVVGACRRFRDERSQSAFDSVILVWDGRTVRRLFRLAHVGLALHNVEFLAPVGIDDFALPFARDVSALIDAIPRRFFHRRLADFLPRIMGRVAGGQTGLAHARRRHRIPRSGSRSGDGGSGVGSSGSRYGHAGAGYRVSRSGT